MRLKYDSPEARDAFISWYNSGSHKDINGNELTPEENPDIAQIAQFFNHEVAYGPAVEVINGED